MSELGVVFYRGPSLLTGDPIVGIVTDISGSFGRSKRAVVKQSGQIDEKLISSIPPLRAKFYRGRSEVSA